MARFMTSLPRSNDVNKPADIVLLAGALALAVVGSLRRMSDTDIWAHLKCGEFFFEKGAILRTHYFNCSWPDSPYLNHEWLFQAIIYKVYSYFGEAGIVTLQVLLVLLSFVVLSRIIRLYTGNRIIAAGVLAVGIMASSHRFVLRPQHFSYVFLLYFLFSLHAYRKGFRKYVWFMPLLMAAWVNIHAESLWGVIVPAVFIAVEYVKTLRGSGMGKADMRRLLFIYSLVLAAAMLNPFGYKTIFWPLFVMKEQFAGVEEILPPIVSRYRPFWAYCLIFAVSSIINARRADPTWLTLSLLFCAVAWTANRGIPHFVFVSGPLVAVNLEDIFSGARFQKRTAVFAASGARVLLALYIFGTIYSVTTHPLFMNKYDSYSYPEGALHFMQVNGVSGNVFNHHAWGGYIIWNAYPRLKPYIDGRFFRKKFYDEFNYILSVGPGWQDLLAKYNITIVLMPYSGTESGTINDRLFSVPHWRLVYWDDESLLYLKDTPENMGVIDRYGNDLFNPDRQLYEFNESSPDIVDKADAAARLNLMSAPGSFKALHMAADTAFLKGDYRTAIDQYQSLMDRGYGKKAWFYYRLARGYKYIGDMQKSDEHAKRGMIAAAGSSSDAAVADEMRLFQQSK